jgi:thioredoxin 1
MAIKTVTKDTFEGEVLASSKPVLVDLWAEWCMPCKAMEPAMKELAQEFEGQVEIAKLNVDENPALAQSLDVMSIPTLMLFKDGKPVSRLVGLQPKNRVAGAIRAALTVSV